MSAPQVKSKSQIRFRAWYLLCRLNALNYATIKYSYFATPWMDETMKWIKQLSDQPADKKSHSIFILSKIFLETNALEIQNRLYPQPSFSDQVYQ